MKISRTLLAKQLAESGDRSHTIDIIQSLLYLMRKFGKSLNSPEVITLLKKEFPDALALYDILGRSSCTVNQCQQLLVSVSRLMDHNHLDVQWVSDSIVLDTDPKDTFSYGDSNVLGLSIVWKGKIYKRTLDGDLNKMVR